MNFYKTHPEHYLRIILIFWEIQARVSYKNVSYKKKKKHRERIIFTVVTQLSP